MSISDKEQLYEWASQNYSHEIQETYLSSPSSELSYFEKKKNHDYLKEYNYETFSQLKEELSQLWADDESLLKFTAQISMFATKGKRQGLKKYKETEDMAGELVDYIYNF